MTLHMKEYCNDAKQQYLDAESFKKATARLTTRTWWKLRELEGWLAVTGFKACKGNKVLGDERARQEGGQARTDGGARGLLALSRLVSHRG